MMLNFLKSFFNLLSLVLVEFLNLKNSSLSQFSEFLLKLKILLLLDGVNFFQKLLFKCILSRIPDFKFLLVNQFDKRLGFDFHFKVVLANVFEVLEFKNRSNRKQFLPNINVD